MDRELEIRRAKLKEAQRLRALFSYEVALKRIDYKLDVEEPGVKAIGEAVAQGQIPRFTGEVEDVRSS